MCSKNIYRMLGNKIVSVTITMPTNSYFFANDVFTQLR